MMPSVSLSLALEPMSSPLEASTSPTVLCVADRAVALPAAWTVSSSSSVDDALDRKACLTPDAIVLEESIIDGLCDALRLTKDYPDVPVVVIAGDEPDHFVRRVASELIAPDDCSTLMLGMMVTHVIEQQRLRREADLAKLRIQELNDDLRSARAKLRDSANIDSLTELLNRRGLHAGLARQLSSIRQPDEGMLAILLDLDGFKAINEKLGDASGNVVLREVGRRIRDALRDNDCASRVGGDEFLIVLPNTGWSEGLQIADRIRLAVSATPVLEAQGPIMITASLGLAYIPDTQTAIDDLLDVTRIALKRSKQAGKNCVGIQGDYGDIAISRSLDTEFGDSVDALRNGEGLYAARHEIMSLASERVLGYEYLSRCSLPVFDGPTDFFRVAAEAGSLAAVDVRCFETCAASSQGVEGVWHHLNLYPSTLMDADPERLLALLPGDPKRYCIEINEQQILGDPSELLDAVSVFRDAGVRIAMDDVGFGRSCMESLIVLEPDVVKIDRTFVTGITGCTKRVHSLKRLLALLESLGAEVIAEGIETQADRKALMELGVVYGQGYLWGMPSVGDRPVVQVA